MNWKYPTLISALKANGLDIYRRDISLQLADMLYQREARETVEEPDIDQPATLEWVKGREGWRYNEMYDSACITGNMGDVCDVESFNGGLQLIMNDVEMPNPTRRQIIAVERFAREMGWV